MPTFFEIIFLVHVRQYPISVVTPKHSSQAWPQKKHPNTEATPKHRNKSQYPLWKFGNIPDYFPVRTSPLMKAPLYCLLPFFKFRPTPTPLPCHLQPPLTVLYVVLFLWLNGWSCHIWCAILLNDNMWRTLMCVLCIKASSWPRFDTWHEFLLVFTGTLIWYRTNKHTLHTQGPVGWHNHISIYLHHLLLAHRS